MAQHRPNNSGNGAGRNGARRNGATRPAAPAANLNSNIEAARRNDSDSRLTTDHGLPVSDDQNSLRAGERGPTALEDHLLREKITHFDHERIPERVVHARGAAAHGHFQVYESLSDLTMAKFLQDPSTVTPVFVRFSTVVGSRGSADTVRDVRGFATKFYTEDGNFDLVGNNIPVFFIQDAIKFPDLVHAIKPEPHNEIPQAASAHDTFWDFAWLTPESTHMLMWVMSDRAIPRSFAMMEGFGVHTFRLVNAEGRSRFVKFHWKPLLGVHSLIWDEAQQIAGKDADFHRRDMHDSLARGVPFEYELAIQVIEEEQEHDFPFDVLDATKIWPEELVPVRRVGKMTLNRNPDNFFAETEQVAFHLGNVVPGIDFSNDPLLQGRLFSYLDTQLLRLAGPNFTQIPINQPLAAVHNNQRDAYHQHRVHQGRVSYGPNSLAGGSPRETGATGGGFVSYPALVSGVKERRRAPSFNDHFSQAALFWRSMSAPEQEHIVSAFRFELGNVEAVHVRERMVDILTMVDTELATRVAAGIGVASPPSDGRARETALQRLHEGWQQFGATSIPGPAVDQGLERSAALSQANTIRGNVKGRKVAVLVADGVDAAAVLAFKETLTNAGVVVEVVAPHLGGVQNGSGPSLPADATFLTKASVVYDGLFVPGGERSVDTLRWTPEAMRFIVDTFRHRKPLAAAGVAVALLGTAGIDPALGAAEGIVTSVDGDPVALAQQFIEALGQHRFFSRPAAVSAPA